MNQLDQLKSVLCNPEGKCCIAGSDEDRAIVDRALEALAQPPLPVQPVREWVALMRGVRVDGNTVVVSVRGGNDAARELCGALIKEINND
jgi:hypothetical protein